MSKITPIALIIDGQVKEGDSVNIRGWIHRTRSSGGMAFVVVRDSTGQIQATVKKDAVHEKHFEGANKALVESAVIVKGTIKKDKRAPGGWELQATEFDVIHFSEVFPISKDKSTEFPLDVRHLWLRSRELTAVMKIKATVLEGFREFFKLQGYWETTPPVIQSTADECGSTLFSYK